MFTKADMLAYKAKSETDLIMAKARVEVINELLSMVDTDEQISVEEVETDDAMSDESATETVY